MNSSKIKKVLNAIVSVIKLIMGFFGKKDDNKTVVDLKQDEQTNKEILKKVNEEIKRKLIVISIIPLFLVIFGCFNFNFGVTEEPKNEGKQTKTEIMLANPLNVYRTSTNIVIKALVQNKKGKWVDAKSEVLIPSGWYIVSGTGLDEE